MSLATCRHLWTSSNLLKGPYACWIVCIYNSYLSWCQHHTASATLRCLAIWNSQTTCTTSPQVVFALVVNILSNRLNLVFIKPPAPCWHCILAILHLQTHQMVACTHIYSYKNCIIHALISADILNVYICTIKIWWAGAHLAIGLMYIMAFWI